MFGCAEARIFDFIAYRVEFVPCVLERTTRLFQHRHIPRLSWPFGPRLRRHHLAAELSLKRLRMLGLGEAPRIPILAVANERLLQRAQAEVLAERMNAIEVLARRRVFGQGDLMGPALIDSEAAQFALASRHAS